MSFKKELGSSAYFHASDDISEVTSASLFGLTTQSCSEDQS
jgi:hypothetical protein